MQTSGTGAPVLLEAGAGEWSSHWHRLLSMDSMGVQWIAYDRAGLGWSPPRHGHRDVAVLADELLALLDAMAIRAPILLVAHSFGASIARVLAAKHPTRVRGVLFVDGWHESFSAWEGQQVPAQTGWAGRLLQGAVAAAMWAGRLRPLHWLLPTPAAPWPLPDDVWRAMLDISASGRCFRAAQREAEAYDAGDKILMTLPPLCQPCMALVARETIRAMDMPEAYPVAEHNAAWQQAGARLAQCSAQGEWQLLTDTDHMVQLNRPDLVVQGVTDLLARTAAGNAAESP
ncbi:MAG TPA: alpha/beta hydrolase, partial [Arenimonas sp.]|nr:alpha/beta hydrolase [Arenimonas sp.]